MGKLMSYFRERRKLKRFTWAWSKVSEKQHKEGNLSDPDYAKCKRAASDPKIMRKLMQKTETDPKLKGGLKDLDWSKIFEWIEVYFWPLFKAVLPLLLLLDEHED